MPTTTEPKLKQLDPNDFYFAQRAAVEFLLAVSDPTLSQRVADLLQYTFERESIRVELLLNLIDKTSDDLDRAKVFAFALGMWGFLPKQKETGDEPIAVGVSNNVVAYWGEQHQSDLEALLENLEGKPLMAAATRILDVLNQSVFLEKNGQPRLALLTLLFSMRRFVPYWQSDDETFPDKETYETAVQSLPMTSLMISLVVRRSKGMLNLAHNLHRLMDEARLTADQRDVVLAGALSAVDAVAVAKGVERSLQISQLFSLVEDHFSDRSFGDDQKEENPSYD